MRPVSEIQLSSPSKVNLFLEVLGKRDDGFHELETVMLRTSLCDLMSFAGVEAESVSLRLSHSSARAFGKTFPLDQSNLILRAAQALQEFANVRRGAEICIHKRIPAEAGLAGGSGNAATTLKGLNQLWQLGLSKPELHEIAATLGSDINFFVEDCRAAVCTGRGEIVRPVPLNAQLHLVAARPATGNSTPEVFRGLKNSHAPRSAGDIVHALCRGRIDLITRHIFNRLTAPAKALNDEMSQLLTSLSTIARSPAFMSGSGSTCFVPTFNARQSRRLKALVAAAKDQSLSFVSELYSQ